VAGLVTFSLQAHGVCADFHRHNVNVKHICAAAVMIASPATDQLSADCRATSYWLGELVLNAFKVNCELAIVRAVPYVCMHI